MAPLNVEQNVASEHTERAGDSVVKDPIEELQREVESLTADLGLSGVDQNDMDVGFEEVHTNTPGAGEDSRMPLDTSGMALICEEYLHMDEDFCRWSKRPYQLPVPALVFERDDEVVWPLVESHEWNLGHAVVVFAAMIYLWWSLRCLARLTKNLGKERSMLSRVYGWAISQYSRRVN